MNNNNSKAVHSKYLCLISGCLIMSACGSTPTSTPASNNPTPETVTSSETTNNNPKTNQTSNKDKEIQILEHAELIQDYLAIDQYDGLIPYIHPTKGVRFSMYAYIHQDTDKVFSREQFATYLQQSRIKFTWGAKDGAGDTYITTLPDFLDSWVAAEQYGFKYATFNKFQGSGNSLNNLKEVYPNADFVEFYHSGQDPQYEGMDWRAMRLVFEEYQGKYYLIAIVNDQWTV